MRVDVANREERCIDFSSLVSVPSSVSFSIQFVFATTESLSCARHSVNLPNLEVVSLVVLDTLSASRGRSLFDGQPTDLLR